MFAFHLRFPVLDPIFSRQNILIVVHTMVHSDSCASSERIQVFQLRSFYQQFFNSAGRKALVADHKTFLDVVGDQKIAVGSQIQHVSGKDLGADWLLLREIKSVKDRQVSSSFQFSLSGPLRKCIDPGIVRLQCSINEHRIGNLNRSSTVPVELYDP